MEQDYMSVPTPDNTKRVMRLAIDLISDDDSNSEYDRAIVEMTLSLLDVSAQDLDKATVAIVLRAMKG